MVLGLILLALVGMVVYAWMLRPQLLEIHPQPGEVDIPVTSSIQLIFSRPMRPETVTESLEIEPALEGSFSWEKNILTFTPDQTWLNGQEIELHLKAGARATSWITFPLEGRDWSFTTSAANVAYLWPSDGPSNIYSLNPVTGEIYPLTHGMSVLEYTVNNNGGMIYFSASNSQGGSDLFQIDRIEAATSTVDSFRPKELLGCGSAQCRSPVVSHDGRYLAYEYLIPNPRGDLGLAQIWLLSLSSFEAKPMGEETHETVQPSWSPTGWLAFYDRTSSQYEVTHPETQARVQIPNQTGQPGTWSMDGEFYLAPEIYYFQATRTSETGTSHLLRYGINTGSSEDISGTDDVEDVEGIYSPDGSAIAFARKYLDETRWSLGRQIWIMKPDGSDSHPITDEADYNHYALAWSQDSLMLAYLRFNQAKLSAPPELWMINANGSNPIQLVIGGFSPQWIP